MMIAQSARRASNVLQCLRLAYGAAGAADSGSLDGARAAAEGFFSGGKVALHWVMDDAIAGAPWPAGCGKVLLNVMILAGEALAFGGAVEVAGTLGALQVTARGRQAALTPAQDAALAGRTTVEALDPWAVQACVTGLFARRANLALTHQAVAADTLAFHIAASA